MKIITPNFNFYYILIQILLYFYFKFLMFTPPVAQNILGKMFDPAVRTYQSLPLRVRLVSQFISDLFCRNGEKHNFSQPNLIECMCIGVVLKFPPKKLMFPQNFGVKHIGGTFFRRKPCSILSPLFWGEMWGQARYPRGKLEIPPGDWRIFPYSRI